MTDLPSAGLVLLILLGTSVVGLLVRPLLREPHRSRETVELVQLVVTMLVTFAALVLGLLTASVKNSFDTTDDYVRGLAVQIIRMDTELRRFGPEADAARIVLRHYTEAAIDSTWRDEPPVAGANVPPVRPLPSDILFEASSLGDMLDLIETDIRHFAPPDSYHQMVQAECLARIEALLDARWRLVEHVHTSLAVPFYVVLVFWLAIVFANLGLSAPRNALAYVTITLGALSIVSVVFVLRDLNSPFDGFIVVSSEPMRDALAHLTR